MAAQPGAHEFGPAVAGVFPGEKRPLAAEFLRFRIHVVHELVDQGNGDLFDLGLGVGDLAHEDVAGGVDAAFGVGVEHGRSGKNFGNKTGERRNGLRLREIKTCGEGGLMDDGIVGLIHLTPQPFLGPADGFRLRGRHKIVWKT